MKKHNIKKLLSITLIFTLFAAYGVMGYAANSSSGGVFETDFSSETDLSVWKQEKADPSGFAVEENRFIIEDGTVKPERQGIIVGLLYKNETYENLLIEAEINKMTRFQFRVGSDSTWSDERFYVEIDFGGAIILRNQDDKELSSTLVYNLVSREMTKVKIRVYGNTVEVYLHDNTEPDFTYTDEQLAVRSGYFSMMFVWQDPNVDNIRLTKLDSQGLHNGVNPITDEEIQSSAPVSSGYNYGSSAVSSSAPASSSAVSETKSSLPDLSDSTVSEEQSSADETSEIEESSELSENEGSQGQDSAEEIALSEASQTASSSDDDKGSSSLKWLIPVIIIVAASAVAAVVIIKKNNKNKESR